MDVYAYPSGNVSSHKPNTVARYWKLIASHLDPILVSISVAVAIFFLFHKIGIFPPLYPWTDESAIAADAVETLVDGPQLVYPAQLAGGSLAVYIEAAFMALFGRGLLGLRVLHALINVSLVALTYAITRRMFASQGKLFSQLVAGLASLWLASSLWLLAMGRIVFLNFALVAPMAVSCFYLLWRGLETGRQWYFISSGFILGLSFYGYVPGTFLPVTLVVFLVAEWLISKLDKRHSLLEMYWKQLVGMAVTAMVIVLPLLFYFVANPQILLHRPVQVVTQSESFSTSQGIFQNLLNTLASFGLFPRRLVREQAHLSVFDAVTDLVFDPLTASFFLIGIVAAIARLKRPPQLFALIWWATLLLPAALSSASVGWKLLHRAVGSEPVTFIFPALGLATVSRWLWGHRPRLIAMVAPPIAAAVLVFAGVYSYRFYFVDWANRPEISGMFAEKAVHFTDWLEAEATSDTVYIFPARFGTSPTARPELFTIRYLYDGQASTAYLPFDETRLAETLNALCSGKSIVKFVLPNRIDLDPKGYLDFLLEEHAVRTNSESRYGYTIKTYWLSSDTERFSNPGPTIAANVEFGQAMRLVDYAASHSSLPAGETLRLTLRWTKLVDRGQDYSVGLSLVDANGYVRAQVDKPLLSDRSHQTTSHWEVGEATGDYYVLPIPAHAPPDNYTIQVIVYTTAGERLPPTNGQADLSSPLTEIQVTPAALPVDRAPLSISNPVDIPVTTDLRVIGLEVSHPTMARPGERLRVSLIWQAASAPKQDYGLTIGLIGEDGLVYVMAPQPLVSASYPTTEWRPGEILQAHYSLLLPPNLSSGDYTLGMRLSDLGTGKAVSEHVLQPLAVEARPHSFSIPSPAHQLNVDFGTFIRLIGYDRPIISQPPGEVTVHIYWQALAEMTESYKVFAHLVDATDTIVAQSDFIPGGGAAPTTSWVKGEMITDTIRIQLPEAVSGGTYHLVIGLYGSTSGARLPLAGDARGEDSLILSEVALNE